MALLAAKYHTDMKAIFILALPLLLAILIQPIVGLIDIKMMGYKDNASWLAALSVAVAIYTQLIGFFSFLFIGTLSSSAIAFGKNQKNTALQIFYRNICMAILFAFMVIGFHKFIFTLAFYLVAPDEQLIIYAKQYLNIRIFFFFIPLINYVASAWLLAQGKSKPILIYDLVFAVFTILFNILFVMILNMNIKGIALGTICAELISLGVLIFIYHKQTNVFQKLSYKFMASALRLRKILQTLSVNAHLFIRILALIGILMLFNRYSNSFKNNEIIAANAIIAQLLFLLTTGFGAFGEASAGFIGKAYGQNQYGRLKELSHAAFILSLSLGIATSLTLLLFLKPISHFLTEIESIKNIIYSYKIWLFILPIPMIIAFTFDGIFMGMNNIKSLRNASVFAFLGFFICFNILPQELYLHRLWIAFFSPFVIRSLYLWLIFNRIIKKGSLHYGS